MVSCTECKSICNLIAMTINEPCSIVLDVVELPLLVIDKGTAAVKYTIIPDKTLIEWQKYM